MNPTDTLRLRIRPFAEQDFDSVTRLLDECFGRADAVERREWLEWSVRNYSALARLHQPPYGDYAVVTKETNELIGSIGLVPSFGPFGQLTTFRDEGQHASGLYRPEMGLFWAVAEAHGLAVMRPKLLGPWWHLRSTHCTSNG